MPSRERGPKDHGYYILRNLVPWPTRVKSRAPAPSLEHTVIVSTAERPSRYGYTY